MSVTSINTRRHGRKCGHLIAEEPLSQAHWREEAAQHPSVTHRHNDRAFHWRDRLVWCCLSAHTCYLQLEGPDVTLRCYSLTLTSALQMCSHDRNANIKDTMCMWQKIRRNNKERMVLNTHCAECCAPLRKSWSLDLPPPSDRVWVWMWMCVFVCVCACVRACVCVCVCARGCVCVECPSEQAQPMCRPGKK